MAHPCRAAFAGCSVSLIALASLRCTIQEGGIAPGAGASSNAGSSLNAAGSRATGTPQGGSTGTPTAGGAGGSQSMLGSGSGAGGALATEPRGPSAAKLGVNYPFPQNRQAAFCTYPSYRNSDVVAAYTKWKADTVTSIGAQGHLRVQRPKEPSLEHDSTVSEGIGYGLIIAVYMNDQRLFDELWRYEQLWLDKNGLMDWYISGNGVDRLGTGAASDADEDMAWALIMADRQWGGSGSLSDSYLNIAKQQIDLIYRFEIQDYELIKPGDTWGDWTTVNASYFAPAYYRAFAKVTGKDGWSPIIETSYDTLAKSLNLANGNAQNGLVPAWCTSDGAPNPNAFMDGTAPTHYQYDSCRTPFRIGLDYCLNGEPRAQAYVAKTSQFFATIGAKQIVDGYDLNGTPKPAASSGQSASFVGPATVGAMNSARFLGFVQSGYDDIASLDLLVGGDYYDESWTVQSLLMLSANFLDFTAQSPYLPK